jgi:subtilisin family serine protease
VTCVGAVTVNGDRLGYSSQGPGGLDPKKPDISGYAHFAGSGIDAADAGTSAATAVVAGVVAALRSRFPAPAPAVVRAALQTTAKQIGVGPWNADFGYGIVRPMNALRALG